MRQGGRSPDDVQRAVRQWLYSDDMVKVANRDTQKEAEKGILLYETEKRLVFRDVLFWNGVMSLVVIKIGEVFATSLGEQLAKSAFMSLFPGLNPDNKNLELINDLLKKIDAKLEKILEMLGNMAEIHDSQIKMNNLLDLKLDVRKVYKEVKNIVEVQNLSTYDIGRLYDFSSEATKAAEKVSLYIRSVIGRSEKFIYDTILTDLTIQIAIFAKLIDQHIKDKDVVATYSAFRQFWKKVYGIREQLLPLCADNSNLDTSYKAEMKNLETKKTSGKALEEKIKRFSTELKVYIVPWMGHHQYYYLVGMRWYNINGRGFWQQMIGGFTLDGATKENKWNLRPWNVLINGPEIDGTWSELGPAQDHWIYLPMRQPLSVSMFVNPNGTDAWTKSDSQYLQDYYDDCATISFTLGYLSTCDDKINEISSIIIPTIEKAISACSDIIDNSDPEKPELVDFTTAIP